MIFLKKKSCCDIFAMSPTPTYKCLFQLFTYIWSTSCEFLSYYTSSRVLSDFFQNWHFPQTHHLTWLMILYSLDFTVRFQTDSVSKVFSPHPWKRFYQSALLSVSAMWVPGCGVRVIPVTLAHIKHSTGSTANSSTSAGPRVRLTAKGGSHLELWQPTGP